jgi:3-phenylpropionate/cinnamic acid dioxygenase small subunit
MSGERHVLNLLHRYAELIDTGDLEGAADLFAHARVHVGPGHAGAGSDGLLDRDGVLALWRAFIVIYPDGTPRTKHVITNEIIDVDDDAGTATCRSYYTVMQQTDGFGLQPIICGRYDDRFERVDGAWRFAWRDYSLIDLVGDMSRHGAQPLPS